MGYTYIRVFHHTICVNLVEDLFNDYALGYNKHPNDVTNVQNMVINYKNNINKPSKRNNISNKILFFQKLQVKGDINISCFGCGKKLHYKSEFPYRSQQEGTLNTRCSATTHITSNKYEYGPLLQIEDKNLFLIGV